MIRAQVVQTQLNHPRPERRTGSPQKLRPGLASGPNSHHGTDSVAGEWKWGRQGRS